MSGTPDAGEGEGSVTENVVVERKSLSRDMKWGFFEGIGDVTDLDPGEEVHSAYTATHDGDIVGMAVVDSTFESTHISRIAVTESYRGNGIATEIITKIVEQESGRMYCRISPENAASCAAFENAGFVNQGTSRFPTLDRYEYQNE